MEGESTSALLSGFVFGALAFQHLSTDSDTVGAAAGPGRAGSEGEEGGVVALPPGLPCPALSGERRGSGPSRPAAPLRRFVWERRKNAVLPAVPERGERRLQRPARPGPSPAPARPGRGCSGSVSTGAIAEPPGHSAGGSLLCSLLVF